MDHHKGANPTADIKPFDGTPRTRYLSEPELVDVWQECGDDDFGRATKLLMLTGCRREEIRGLEWGEALLFAKNPHCPNGQIELPAHRVS
jgi:integrase